MPYDQDMSKQYTFGAKLKKLPELRWDDPKKTLEYGAVYRIVGTFHVADEDNVLRGVPHAVVAARYMGQLGGNPERHWFSDSDGTRYLVSSPRITSGITTARIYRFTKTRQRASVAA